MQEFRYVFIWKTVHTLLSFLRLLGQWGYAGKLPPHLSRSRVTQQDSSNTSQLSTMQSHVPPTARPPPAASSKKSYPPRAGFLMRQPAPPEAAGGSPVSLNPVPPPPSGPELCKRDNTRTPVTRPPDPSILAKTQVNNSVVSIFVFPISCAC